MSANYNIIQGGSTFNLNISTENIKLNNNTIRLVCDSTTGSIVINLPKISDTPNIDFTVYIDDFGDMASTNNITLVCDPSNTIDNAPNYVISTDGQKVQIYVSSVNEYGVFQNSNSVSPAYIPTISVTYAQLLALKNASTLVVGQKYLITDFQTVHLIPNTAVVNMGSIEPIIVTASAVNSINAEAMSTLYPQDIILYELVDSTTIGGTKGRITYRKDLIRNISMYYDWRNVLYRRWETTPASGFFTVITDNGNSFQDYPTFPTVSPFPFPISRIEIAKCIFFPNQVERLNNVVFQSYTESFICKTGYFIDSTFKFVAQWSNIEIGVSFENNTIDLFLNNTVLRSTNFRNNNLPSGGLSNNLFFSDFYSNTLSVGSSFAFSGNEINSSFNNNIFEGGDVSSNVFNMICNQNTFKGTFSNNMVNGNGSEMNSYFYGNVFETGKTFASNDISGRFILNSMNVDFQVNTIWRDFSSNVFNTPSPCSGNKFLNTFNSNTIVSAISYVSSLYDNTITAQCSGNTFDNVTASNTISGVFFNGNILLDNFAQNKISGNFSGNTCGSSFVNNEITQMNNCTIGNGFNSNIVKSIQFDTNVIGSSFSNNSIQGELFNSNNISAGFYKNTIDSNVASCTFGTNFANNNIQSSSFSSNNVGSTNFSYCDIRKSVGSFNGNTIPYSTNNTWMNNSFTNNNVTGFLVNITFEGALITSSTIDNLSSLSTGTYSKKVSLRSDGTNILTYINNLNVVQYKDPLLP